MIADFKANREEVIAQPYKGHDILAFSETFEIDAVLTLIANSLCRKVRIYYGMDDEKKVHAIMVAVDSANNDILPTDPDVPTPMILEDGQRCPTLCPTSSDLNS
jgi:hypothetical protein